MTTEKKFEEYLIKAIIEEKKYDSSFQDLVSKFDEKLEAFNFLNNSVTIEDYFYFGAGDKSIIKKLINDNKVKVEWCREYYTKDNNKKFDFKGIYFFLLNDKPFYIGISKGVIGRICQHIKGKNHNTSSLAYKLGLLRFEYLNKRKHIGTRKELNFENEVEPVKKFLQKQRIAWIPIENDEELYLFEIYCSMKYKTILNDFKTH